MYLVIEEIRVYEEKEEKMGGQEKRVTAEKLENPDLWAQRVQLELLVKTD